MSNDICMMPATALIEGFRSGNLSPVDVTDAALARIEALDGVYNAFVLVDAECARAEARRSEQRWHDNAHLGALDGVPATVKDLMLAKGWPTRRGSLTTDPKDLADEDTPCVARMREHGAIFLGKTTTPEFGWKGVTDSPLTGSTRNPWNPERTSGGSSGGAAVSAALGMGALNIASDGGGSIRMPAGFCGVYGIKPTFGVVPIYPHSAMGTLSHHGPITRTVADAALMLTVMAEPDVRDWFAGPPRGLDYAEGLEDGIAGLRIAFSPTLGFANVDPEVAALVEKAAHVMADLGAIVEPVDPGFDDPIEMLEIMWAVGCAVLVDTMNDAQRAKMDTPILDLAERGRAVSATELRGAEQRREALGRLMNGFLDRFDLLLTPQLPLTAFRAGLEFPEGRGFDRWWQWSPFTYPFNLTQHPAATIPCGFAPDGLPVTFQIVGPKFREDSVLRASRAYETRHPFVMPAPANGNAPTDA